MQWEPIEKYTPDMLTVDVWSKEHGRLADYRYDRFGMVWMPTRDGVCCVNDVTHFMVVEGPEKST